LEFIVPFQHKFGYIRDKIIKKVTSVINAITKLAVLQPYFNKMIFDLKSSIVVQPQVRRSKLKTTGGRCPFFDRVRLQKAVWHCGKETRSELETVHN